jgi:hypothetical protein
LNKIYLAASKLKIAVTFCSTYNFFPNDSFGSYYLFYYNYHYNPQGLYIIISPPGLFGSLSKEINIRSLSQQSAEINTE